MSSLPGFLSWAFWGHSLVQPPHQEGQREGVPRKKKARWRGRCRPLKLSAEYCRVRLGEGANLSPDEPPLWGQPCAEGGPGGTYSADQAALAGPPAQAEAAGEDPPTPRPRHRLSPPSRAPSHCGPKTSTPAGRRGSITVPPLPRPSHEHRRLVQEGLVGGGRPHAGVSLQGARSGQLGPDRGQQGVGEPQPAGTRDRRGQRRSQKCNPEKGCRKPGGPVHQGFSFWFAWRH